MNRLTSKKVKDYMSYRTDEEFTQCPEAIAAACNEMMRKFNNEFNLGYDNKLELSDLTFTDAYDLVEAIVTKIEKQFKIEQDETNE